TDRSKFRAETSNTRSPGPTSCIRFTQSIRLLTGRWVTSTPFGVPVEPDVKMTYAASSGCAIGSRPWLGEVADTARTSGLTPRRPSVESASRHTTTRNVGACAATSRSVDRPEDTATAQPIGSDEITQ